MNTRATAADPGGQTRTETDSLGPVQVPAARLWGAQTQRSLLNFEIGVQRFRWGRPVIRAFGILKKAASFSILDLVLLL